jgi:hypothetical protein
MPRMVRSCRDPDGSGKANQKASSTGVREGWSVLDRSSNLPGPPTSVAASVTALVVRVVFFGGSVVLLLFWRSSETESGNRTFLVVFAALMGAFGLFMVFQSVLDILWLRGRKQARSD